MKTILLTMTALFMLSEMGASAQVTIGELKDPESFSILELDGKGERGLRLPQLDTDQRDALNLGALTDPDIKTKALGLQIFNTDTQCVETWNGVEWIQACYNNTPTPLSIAFDNVITCGITQDGNTFTAPDLKAVKYEFFVGGTSQGKQKGNSINIDDSQLPAEVNVKYYYPASFLKPKMLPVVGSSSWKYGTGGTGTDIVITNAVITDFTMSATQITQAQYEYVFPDRGGLNSSAGGNNFACSTDPDYSPSSSKPAEMINWYAAIAYCNKLSKKESKKPCYSVTVSGVEVDWANLTYANIPGNSTNNADWDAATCDFTADGYRLPTEWEWEYAARGGTNVREWEYSGSAAIGGSADISDIAWYWDNVGHTAGNADYGTHPVGALAANDLGLYDMSGNVYEWCWNWDNAIYDGSSSGTPFSTPTGNAVGSGGGSSSRVLRGGGWSDDVSGCRVSRRFKHTPYYRGNGSGFRVVCR